MTGGIPNVTKSGLSLEIAENQHQHPKIHHLAHRDPPFSTFITETLRIVNSHWNPKTVTCVPLKSMRSAGPVSAVTWRAIRRSPSSVMGFPERSQTSQRMLKSWRKLHTKFTSSPESPNRLPNRLGIAALKHGSDGTLMALMVLLFSFPFYWNPKWRRGSDWTTLWKLNLQSTLKDCSIELLDWLKTFGEFGVCLKFGTRKIPWFMMVHPLHKWRFIAGKIPLKMGHGFHQQHPVFVEGAPTEVMELLERSRWAMLLPGPRGELGNHPLHPVIQILVRQALVTHLDLHTNPGKKKTRGTRVGI